MTLTYDLHHLRHLIGSFATPAAAKRAAEENHGASLRWRYRGAAEWISRDGYRIVMREHVTR